MKNLLGRGRSDEAVDVDVDEGGHQELAVEPIHDPAVSGNDVAEILKQINFFYIEKRKFLRYWMGQTNFKIFLDILN